MGQGQLDSVQPNAPPEDLLGAAQGPSDFPVFVQHMPGNDGIPAYNELNWHLVEMLDLKHFKETVELYGLYSPFDQEMANTWAMQNRLIP